MGKGLWLIMSRVFASNGFALIPFLPAVRFPECLTLSILPGHYQKKPTQSISSFSHHSPSSPPRNNMEGEFSVLTICAPHWKKFDTSHPRSYNCTVHEENGRLRLVGSEADVVAASKVIVSFYARRGWGPRFKRMFLDGGASNINWSWVGGTIASWDRSTPVERALNRKVTEGKVVTKTWGWLGRLQSKGQGDLPTVEELNGTNGRNTTYRAGLDSEEQLQNVIDLVSSRASMTKDYHCNIVRLTDLNDPYLREYNIKKVEGSSDVKVTQPLGKRWVVDTIFPGKSLDIRIAVSAEVHPYSPPDGLVEAANGIFDSPGSDTSARIYGARRYTNSPYQGPTRRWKRKFEGREVSYMVVVDYRKDGSYHDIWVKAKKHLTLSQGVKAVARELVDLKDALQA